jgi:hypothetical protein
LNSYKTQYLVQICVSHITLTDCNIFVLEERSLSSPVIDKCLKTLDLSQNPIVGTKFAPAVLVNFRHIEALIMENAFRSCNNKRLARKEKTINGIEYTTFPVLREVQFFDNGLKTIKKTHTNSEINFIANKQQNIQSSTKHVYI